jgi:AcrR family transcriptional regulator
MIRHRAARGRFSSTARTPERDRLRPMPDAAPVIVAGRPAMGLTFLAIDNPPPIRGTRAYQIDGTPEYHDVQACLSGRDSVMAVRTAQHEAMRPENVAPAEFRRRLLEGMAAAVRESGFRDSTVADVVRHARTSRRTFYEHFPSKQACFIALLQDANAGMVRQIAAAVDRHARWDVQVRQAVEAWIAVAQSDLPLTMSWIRDLPSLGSDARHLQREWLEAFVVLIKDLTDTPELRAAGVAPPSRQLMIMLLGGLRELIATTVEDGGDIGSITEVAVQATQALLAPPRPATPAS